MERSAPTGPVPGSGHYCIWSGKGAIIALGNRSRCERLLLDQFGEHRAFSGPDGEANLEAYLRAFGARQLIHGHTPVPRMLQAPPESVTAAYVYRDGRCVNVDPGMYLGGPGFAYRVQLTG